MLEIFIMDKKNAPKIVGGRYGLGSKDTNPSQMLAVYKHLDAENPRHNFTVGIEDDVTNLSLPIEEKSQLNQRNN